MSISAHRKDFQMFEVQITKGVEYLDRSLGNSWPERIDLEGLRLDDCLSCVIGQLYGNYYHRFEVEQGFHLGFSLDDGSFYPELTTEWKDKIAQLQAERQA